MDSWPCSWFFNIMHAMLFSGGSFYSGFSSTSHNVLGTCGHVLSAILKNICIYLFNCHIVRGSLATLVWGMGYRVRRVRSHLFG